jgi:hypothetical protein
MGFLSSASKPHFNILSIHLEVGGSEQVYAYQFNESYNSIASSGGWEITFNEADSLLSGNVFKISSDSDLFILNQKNIYYNYTDGGLDSVYNSIPYGTRNGWTNGDDTVFITDNDVYYGTDINNLSQNSLWDTISRCNYIRTLPSLNLQDIACSQYNDCVIVGSYGQETPLAFQFNPEFDGSCELIDLSSGDGDAGVLINESPIYSVTYAISNQYGFVGKNIIGFLNTFPIANINATIEENPLCYSDQNYLCSKPYFDDDGGFFYCDTENSLYCNEGCDNIIFDDTTGEQFIYPKQTCNTYYDVETTKSLDCFQNYFSIDSYISRVYNLHNQYGIQCAINEDTIVIPRANCEDSEYDSYYLQHPNNDVSVIGLCKTSDICEDECVFNGQVVNINGYKECTSLNSFQTCGNYDTDQCLELSSSTVCIFGNYCYGGNCVDYPTGTYEITYPQFTTSPETNEFINYNAQTRTVNNNDDSALGIQRFAILTNTANTTYTSQTCKYSEQSVYNLSASEEVLGSTEKTFMNSAQDTILTFALTNNATIIIKDFTDAEVMKFYQNSSGGQTCISFMNHTGGNETLWCATYGDSINVKYELNYYQDNSVFQIHTSILGYAGYSQSYSRPIKTITASSINKINITTDNSTLSYLQITYPTPYKPYLLTQKNNYNFLVCTYTANGCYNVRTYQTFTPSESFQNYNDILVCMNNINGVSANDYETGSSDDFIQSIPIMWRYIIMLIVVMIFFIVPLILAGSEGVIAGLSLSAIISITMSIIFGLSLLIPIVYTVIAGGVVAILIRKTVTG